MFHPHSSSRVVLLVLALATVSCGRTSEEIVRDHVARGDEHVKNKKYQEAILEYRNAIQEDGQSGDAHRKLAIAYEAAGDARGAFRASIRAADILTDDVEAQLKAANYLLLSQQFEDAQTRVLKVLERDPRNVEAQIIRANALAGLKNLEGALTQIEEAIALEPARALSYTNLAVVKLAQGKREEAASTFEKAVELDPSSAPARLALANFQWAVGEGEKAEQTLRGLLEIHPEHPLANRALAVLYLTTNRAAAAEPHLKRMVEGATTAEPKLALADYYIMTRRPEDARPVLTSLLAERGAYASAQSRLASLEYAAGRRPQAHTMLDELLAREPRNAGALIIKARWLMAERNVAEAHKRALAAVQADGNFVPAHYLLGSILAAQLDFEAAAQSFREVLRLNPRAVPAQLALSQMELRQGRPAAAVELAKGALESAPNHPLARLNIARALIAQRDLTRAESELRALLAQYPTVAAVHAAQGLLLMAQGNVPLARGSFTRALELEPSLLEALNGMALADLQQNQPAAARSRVEAALANQPDRVDLMLLAARVYGVTRDVAAAERTLLKAIRLAPAQMDGYKMLANVYLMQNKLDAAQKEFDDLARRNPKDMVARTMGAMIVHQKNNIPEAKKRYADIVEIDPKAAVAANNLAWIYAEERGDLDRALTLAQRAAQLLPQSAEAQDTLGWVYHQKELPALAIPPLRRSIELDPRNASYHYHLGLAYLKHGDRDKARVALQQALKLDPASPQAAEVQKALASLRS